MTSILLVAPKYNYGRARDGLSYEYCNFYESLVRAGYDVALFDFMRLEREYGREAMNTRLADVVSTTRPDVLFAVPHRGELSPTTLRHISDETETQTISWFSDDHWRFESYTRHMAPAFNWSVTTATSALPKYAAIGYAQVIKSQWACNHFLYHPVQTRLRYDVTFVGQPHGTRRRSVAAIREAGVDIRAWGSGWPDGRADQDYMLRVFSASRINLNLSNSSPSRAPTARVMAALWRAAGSDSLSASSKRLVQAALATVERMARPLLPPEAWDPDSPTHPDQIKGRNFEVPGCGGFLLTGKADDIHQYYIPGQQIATFSSVHEMIAQIKFYLAHEELRVAVAAAGYERTLREHTYVHRFASIFAQMGLTVPPLDDMLAERISPGQRAELS